MKNKKFAVQNVKQFRQGDILIERVERPRQWAQARQLPPQPRGVVLAEGETTGHAHVIAPENASLFTLGDETFLDVGQEGELTHEEHATITLPPGTYRVTRQREYHPEGARIVMD